MSHPIIDNYRDFYQDHHDVFVASNESSNASSLYTKYDIADRRGRGWIDLYQISHGLMIGRGQFALHAPWQCEYSARCNNLSLYILLAGKVRVSGARCHCCREFGCGSVLVHEHCASEPYALRYEQMPQSRFEGVSIEVPAALVDALRREAQKNRQGISSGVPLEMTMLNPQHQCHQYGLQVARMMLNLQTDSVIGRLQAEAAALDLITKICIDGDLLHCPDRQCLPLQHRIAVDEAVAILEREFHKAHTITSLSRRVQLNECYLKSAFRKITGCTIADYLRRQRMAHARHLIEKQQATVLHAALSVGYSNPSHFTAAFRAVYGVLPSNLKQAFA